MLNEAWNEKANNVWEEAEILFKAQEEALRNSGEASHSDWRNIENQRMAKVEEMRKSNYQERQAFYLGLFSGYDFKEFYFEETNFEKRLIEEFVERGEEICDNIEDDNENGQADCADDQCAGKVCGTIVSAHVVGNESVVTESNLYCISGTCQLKEGDGVENKSICGNNICENGEEISCVEDCTACKVWEAIECSGKVIFSGEDASGCPLEPICIEEVEFCEVDADCPQPLCGNVICGEDNKCQMQDLALCGEKECTEGDKRFKECSSGEKIIADACIRGLWVKTGTECRGEDGIDLGCTPCGNRCITREESIVLMCMAPTTEFDCVQRHNNCIVKPKEIVGDECNVKEDCGGEDDVCSNGKCVTIPKIIKVDVPEIPETSEEEEQEVVEEVIDGESESEPQEQEVEEVVEEPVEEPQESEPEEVQEEEIVEEAPAESNEAEVTGNFIFNLFRGLGARITGGVVMTGSAVDEGGDTDTESEPAPEPSPEPEEETPAPEEPPVDNTNPETPEPPQEGCSEPGPAPNVEENCWWKETYDDGGCVSGYDVECGEWSEDRERGEERMDEFEEEDNWEERFANCKEKCKPECEDKLDEERQDVEMCIEDCAHVCSGGGNMDDFTKFLDENAFRKEEKGVFTVGGGCRTEMQQTQGFIWFGGWGDPFDDIQDLKHKYYEGGEADWCKWELDNLKKQRKEFEKGFNQDFAKWFFEDYLTSSAENWEQSSSGIFELYWTSVDNQMRMAHSMQCLGINSVEDYKLLNMSYESEYGSLEYWEEVKEVKLPEMDKKITLISPYMKVWIFPNKEFIKYDMQKSMENHEFPGPPEEKMEREKEEGLTEEEKKFIRQDKSFMKMIEKATEDYEGNLDVAVQFKDYETDEIVFNLYVQINEEDIMIMEPMPVSEIPAEDVRVVMDFSLVYDMIYEQEKEMMGTEIESPPWDKKDRRIPRVKDITNGIKMYFKIRGIINSAEVFPEGAESDAKDLMKEFLSMMPEDDRDRDEEGEEKDEGDRSPWEDEKVLTGEVIAN
ncbi:hypothetical protein GOV13_02605 [Candidatus Pacearchaeota archaeon]|nr:hypothetical protein [Candidatus Pacearchaeota archaeon]